jgi:hypothetical protein
MNYSIVACWLLAAVLVSCGEGKTPQPKSDAATDSRPVKNVESLPSGTIQEGARTMNRAADMGGSLEQQKQEREGQVESQGQ